MYSVLASNIQNCVGFWGSAPDPAGGAYDAPPDPLVVRASCLWQSQLRAFGACNYPDAHVLVGIPASKPPFHLFAPPTSKLWLRHCYQPQCASGIITSFGLRLETRGVYTWGKGSSCFQSELGGNYFPPWKT